MASRNEVVYTLAQEWLIWLNSRRFLGQPMPKNILVMLAEKNLGGNPPPDGPMSAQMSAFNLAVNSITEDYRMVPFLTVYADYRPKPIKTLAADLGIARDTFYEKAHEAAAYVLRTARQLEELNASVQKEIAGFVD